MKISSNVITQLIGVAAQLFNQFGGFIPDKQKPLVAALVGIAQGVGAIVAHYSNPDGTDASKPYVKP